MIRCSPSTTRSKSQLASNLTCNLRGSASHIHPDRIFRRLQNLELAVQQIGIHEMALPGSQPLLNHVLRSTQADVMNDIQIMPQVFLVGMLEGGTAKDDVFPTVPGILDQSGKSLEPGFAVLVGKRNPLAHLLDVRRWLVVVGVMELPAEF